MPFAAMETAALLLSLADLRARLPELMLRDRDRLGRRIESAAALRDAGQRERTLSQVLADLDKAAARIEARRRAVPTVSYPPELPVSQRRTEIAAAIRDHQVVIIAGETGSGKTTQLPKICLELGRGITGQIGHTQPRRLAARTMADRIAEELGTEPGTAVGYQVRFTDTSSDDTYIKLMTDGILLTEMQRDRQLLRYDTLIIDEAHERSLNIDFILGYLRQLLPSRPDLKVIITSATIDPERFSHHFAEGESGKRSAEGESGKHFAEGESGRRSAEGESGRRSAEGESGRRSAGGESGRRSAGAESGSQGSGAPVIEVSGRAYPVQVRYRPLTDLAEPGSEPRDQVQAISDAVDELSAEGPGDILVFLSGEREIRDTAEALAGRPDTEVVPLYARLSAAEQHRVFQSHRGRRVVLATNVAETSLTVPGIKYVVDPGTARISRYSHRTKVQRLPIEPISQASANQRAGRCGRTSDGVCIRLYTEEDFAGRPEFTDPEILRTHLASVILRMAALDLGSVADFPFVDPPDARNISDGIGLLEELGAVSAARGSSLQLTGLGRKLARIPADPRLGRMILAAGRNGCAREVLIITAALSITDPRERPAEAREAADALHARFAQPGSDFLALLTLWDYLRDQQRELSGSAFRRMCRREYLHYLRVREWQDVYGQLRQAARDVGIVAEADRDGSAGKPERGRPAGDAAESDAAIPADLADLVHQSLLAGLLSHIGMQDDSRRPDGKRRGPAEFAGARGARFAIFPDSVLARKPPQWVVASELVETARLWGRVAARIEPEWAEPLAAHLVRRSYSEPHWDARRGAAMASEKVSLYGLPIVAARQISYGRIDPVAARELFISRALVEGDWQTHHVFFQHNRDLLAEAQELERRSRRRGLVADDAAQFGFYDQRIPKDVTSARHFDSWWKQARTADPDLLKMRPADLAGPGTDDVDVADYPSMWGGLPLSYEFTPGEPDDGIAVDIPLARLNQVTDEEFSWQIPGVRQELVTELIRSLPKRLRTAFVPAPDVARKVLARLDPARGDLLDALRAELGRLGGVTIPSDAWDLSRLPDHLRLTFRVVDDDPASADDPAGADGRAVDAGRAGVDDRVAGGGRVLAAGKDLAALRQQLRPKLQAVLADAASGITRSGLRSWDFESLPRVFSRGQVRAYPALADTGDAVDIALFETEAQAAEAMRLGVRRLLLIEVPSGARSVGTRLPSSVKLAMSRHPYPSVAALLDDCAACAADEVITKAGGPAWDAAAFQRLLEAARSQLRVGTADVVSAVGRVLAQAHAVEVGLDQATSVVLRPAVADMRTQLSGLIYSGFVSGTGAQRLPDLVRYLRGISQRLDKAPSDPGRDIDRMAVVHRVTESYQRVLSELGPSARYRQDARAVRWMIEELRVSLFAQTLGTAFPVSEQRLQTALDRLVGR
jgi:ATP-dependent helicase HrpA